jgi:hypothetical protein
VNTSKVNRPQHHDSVGRIREPVFVNEVTPEGSLPAQLLRACLRRPLSGYAFTTGDAVYDLMARFVLATAPTFEPKARRLYVEALAAVPGLVEQKSGTAEEPDD